MVGKDFNAKGRHWFVLEEDTPHQGERIFLCCLFYQRNRKWRKHPKKEGVMVGRTIEFFKETEIKTV